MSRSAGTYFDPAASSQAARLGIDFEFAYTERTPRVVAAVKLLRAAGRKKAGVFLAEGDNAVDAALATGAVRDLFVSATAVERYPELVELAGRMNVYVHPVTDKAVAALSDMVTPTGLVAVCSRVLWAPHQVLGRSPQLVAVPVETREPGNTGTLIRAADALGADCVLFAGDCADPQGPKAVRASAGSLFHIPVAKDPDLKAAMQRLRAKGLQICATTAQGELSLDEAGPVLEKPTAWLFGNEAHGLPEWLVKEADYRVRIPIRGRAESLNLATAASICLYESAKAHARVAATAVAGDL